MVARLVSAPRARAIMVLGTASNVGKSLIATALCRIFARRGVRVAPFKAQNMSLNSAATPDGREIGRAQALQAEAAGVRATSDMNPVLLKPTSDVGSQAVVDGKIWGNVKAADFTGETKRKLWSHVTAAYDRLSSQFEMIVIEGAGSPAEINLRAGDIVNMAVAHYANADCMLLADIDRGGAFASVVGTLALLDDEDRARIRGYAFNKFRGDGALIAPGIDMLRSHVGAPCLGVIPYVDTVGLEEEDSVDVAIRIRRSRPWSAQRLLRIAVVAFPHMSNFTDFDALEEERAVDVRFVQDDRFIDDADVIILPGTKNTISDLDWIVRQRLDRTLLAAAERGVILLGICGGMQILGERIDDPHGVEGGGSARGLALLPISSVFAAEKTTREVRASSRAFGDEIEFHGYEIHVGETAFPADSEAFSHLRVNGDVVRDGIVAERGAVVGTYVHGLFSSDALRHAFLRWAQAKRGLLHDGELLQIASMRERRLDLLGDVVERSLDLDAL